MWELDYKESWALKKWCFWNVGPGEDSWVSLGLQREQTSPFSRKWTLNMHWKHWWWIWSSNTLATWCEEPTHWKRLWCWERLKAGGEDGTENDWIASSTQWTWFFSKLGVIMKAREAWWAAVHEVRKSWARLNDKNNNKESVQFSQPVVSDPLWPHGLQLTRLPCPSPTPGAYSKECVRCISCSVVSDSLQPHGL